MRSVRVGLGLCAPGVPVRIERLLVSLGLPVTPPRGLDRSAIARALAVDKKRRRGEPRFVLTRAIGGVTVRSGVRGDAALEELARGRYPGRG
jgi:3-dehydroquinate synthetase